MLAQLVHHLPVEFIPADLVEAAAAAASAKTTPKNRRK
jgi:hypothetical protein